MMLCLMIAEHRSKSSVTQAAYSMSITTSWDIRDAMAPLLNNGSLAETFRT